MSILLATSADLSAGEPGAAALDAELTERGVDFAWVQWDDPTVDWSSASLVAVRSTWDYVTRHAEFLAWATSLDPSRLLNGADVFAWNHDKRYLTELGDLPAVPTVAADDRAGLARAVADFGTAVVKPRVGAGGAGLIVVTDPADPRLGEPVRSHQTYPEVGGPWVVQPLVESIHTTARCRSTSSTDDWRAASTRCPAPATCASTRSSAAGCARPTRADWPRSATWCWRRTTR